MLVVVDHSGRSYSFYIFIRRKFRAANFPTANFFAAKIPRTILLIVAELSSRLLLCFSTTGCQVRVKTIQNSILSISSFKCKNKHLIYKFLFFSPLKPSQPSLSGQIQTMAKVFIFVSFQLHELFIDFSCRSIRIVQLSSTRHDLINILHTRKKTLGKMTKGFLLFSLLFHIFVICRPR